MLGEKLFTIGFTQTSAESFFERLRGAGVRRVIDVRLSNRSQLAGCAKQQDLRYFLRALGRIEYVHELDLAPTANLLAELRTKQRSWESYAAAFVELLRARRVEDQLARVELDRACLLCSEPHAHRCHRRLVAEYLRERWGGIEIAHL